VNEMSEDVSKGQLFTSILNSAHIASIVTNAVNLQLDIDRAQGIKNTFLANLRTDVREENKYVTDLAKKPFQDAIDVFSANLGSDLKYITDELFNQAVQSATGYGLTARMMGERTKIYSLLNIVDTENSVLFSAPERILLNKAQRYYNKLIAPNFPGERDAFILAKNNFWSNNDFVELLQEMNGLSKADAEKILQIRLNQVGVPDLRTGWNMVAKGLITKATWLSIAKWGYGFSESMANALYKYYDYDFSAMELFRFSDLMPVPETWLDKKLEAIGLNEEDKTVMKNLFTARTLKDEVAQMWHIMAENYSWGLHTEEELKTFLTQNNVPEIQANAKIKIANMLKDKVVLKLMRDAEIYLYRKSISSEDELYANLLALNIDTTVSNAITRNEASKKGIEWELPA